MGTQTSDPGGLPKPPGVPAGKPVFVPLTASLVTSATRLSAQAGWNQVPADWERFLRVSGADAYVWVHNGEVRASYSVVRYSARIAWIGMILVDVEYRGMGLGGTAFDGALDACGVEAVAGLDATDLGEPIYRRRGFEGVLPISRWIRDKPGSGADVGVSELDPAVVDFDMRACGVERSELLSDLLRAGGRLLMHTELGRVVAYGILRLGRMAYHLGPLVAESPEAFAAIIAMAAAAPGPVMCDSLSGEVEDVLEAAGYQRARQLLRMTRPFSRQPLTGPAVRCAAGFELG